MKQNKTTWTFHDKELEQLRRVSIEKSADLAKYYNSMLNAVKTSVERWFPDLNTSRGILALPAVPERIDGEALDTALRTQHTMRVTIKNLYSAMTDMAREASTLVQSVDIRYEIVWDIPVDETRISLRLKRVDEQDQ